MNGLEQAEQEALKAITEAQTKHEEFLDSSIETRVKVCLNGLKATADCLEIAPDLKIQRVSIDERSEFFRRAETFAKSYSPTEHNEFFLINDATHARRQFHAPGARAMLVSSFLAIGLNKILDMTVGQTYVRLNGEFQSTGVYKSPFDSSFYDRDVEILPDDLLLLRALWPAFRDTYVKSPYLRLISRRYYLSRTRTQWEDCLIDLIIALEAFMAHDVKENKSSKVKKRLAGLLTSHFQRPSVIANLDFCYKARNEIVHGNDPNSLENSTRPMLDQLSMLVRIALQDFVMKYSELSPIEFILSLDRKRSSASG